jgi:hypothetical protein
MQTALLKLDRRGGDIIMKESQYLKKNRLADVLALMQVLALDIITHRGENALEKELQGTPLSAKDWKQIGKEHPEFFRVGGRKSDSVSLIARHVQPLPLTEDEKGRTYEKLTPEHTTKLMETAIKLHDSQFVASRWWTFWMPVLGAFIGVVLAKFITK